MANSTPFIFFAVFFLFFWSLVGSARAQPATLSFQDCFQAADGNVSEHMIISTVYGQIVGDDTAGRRLNITILGESPTEILGLSNTSTDLATLFTTTEMLTLQVWSNSTYLCDPLRPASPLPSLDGNTTYCPVAAGAFGLSTSIPWNSNHELTTLHTEIRAVDPFNTEILCLDVATTPLRPGTAGSVYGNAAIIFWSSVGLAIGYWLLVGIARIVSAWGRGVSRGPGLWYRVESAGFILASAISGERLAKSPALMRFGTPSMRDIIFHTQWCAILAMVAVEWPPFVYPLLAQTAWATLSYNITISQDTNAHWNPLSVEPYNPPSNFADQLNDPSSPLYIDASVGNVLFNLPSNASRGIESFAYTVGLRPRDLFGICLSLFLAIIAGTILLSGVIWAIDGIASSVIGAMSGHGANAHYTAASKEGLESLPTDAPSPDDNRSVNNNFLFRVTSKLPTSSRKGWWKRFKPDITSFHGNVLHGNLVRILVLFHLPVTLFSCYQMTIGRGHASNSSIALAALSFALFSVLLPIFIVFRLTTTSTNKLYDETRTLLFLGPLYNHYRHGSQLFASLLFATNLAFGITIGCGQKSGTAQAIIILVIEVVSALVTSIWLPWGSGASMGLISFLFCVARIVIAVLLVILSPTISIGTGAGGWVAYGILVILALVYVAFLLMLIVKVIEALVRIFGGIGFDRSRHVVDSGLFGACGLLACCGGGRRRSRRSIRHRYKAREVQRDQVSEVSSYAPPSAHVQKSESTHSAPPASVLRPEQALKPYREDSDDESGFIMGAWQPFPRAGYNAVGDQAPPTPPPNASKGSGFSRVGGGRAHFESPYAITTGSTHTFPSVERGSTHTAALGPVFDDDDSPPPTASIPNIGRQANPALPAGAMSPAHVRTRSQTAIIEDASALNAVNRSRPSSARPSSAGRNALVSDASRTPSAPVGGGDDDDDSQPRRKHWFQLRKPRRHSEGDHLQQAADDAPAPPAEENGGRSFVVIRDRKPPAASPSRAPPTSFQDPGPTSPRERSHSFVVLR